MEIRPEGILLQRGVRESSALIEVVGRKRLLSLPQRLQDTVLGQDAIEAVFSRGKLQALTLGRSLRDLPPKRSRFRFELFDSSKNLREL